VGEEEARQYDQQRRRSDVPEQLRVMVSCADLAQNDQPPSAPLGPNTLSSRSDRNFRALSAFAQSPRNCDQRVPLNALLIDCDLRTAHCFSTTASCLYCSYCRTLKKDLKNCCKKKGDVLVVLACAEGSSCRTFGSASASLGSYWACLASKVSEQGCVQLDGANYWEIEAFVGPGLEREEPYHRHDLDSTGS